MAIGSVYVEVRPDARGFHEKLTAALRNEKVDVKVNLDAAQAKAEIAKLGKNQKVKVGVDLNDTTAKTRLRDFFRPRQVVAQVSVKDAVAKARLDALTDRQRQANIKANLNAKIAQARLDKLTRPRDVPVRAKVSGLSEASQGIASLSNAIFALGPALIPATAALAGLAGALATPLATAGGGLGLFAVLSGAAIAKASKDAKAITASQQKVTSLQALSQKYQAKAADSSGKQAASYRQQAAAYDKQAKAQQRATNQMMADLPKSEQSFLKAKDSISKGFDTLLAKSNIFQPLAAGASLLGKVLPRLSPITDAFGKALTGVIHQLGAFSRSQGFESAIRFIARDGVSSFRAFAKIASNVAVGIGGLVKAFAPLGTTVLGTITRATGAFRAFGQAAGAGKSKGFQAFLDYVHRVGPVVGRTLGDVAVAVGHVVAALAPQGGTILGVIDALAKTVVRLKPGQIAAIATAVGALGLATGKFGAVKGLTLLVSGLSYAYSHSSAFKTLADDAGRLAAALNNLPNVAKIAGGVALAGAAVAVRGGVKSGGGIAGAVSRAVGGGVQKVFVVNMAEGGLGGAPGKGGVTKTIAKDAEKGLPGLIAALPTLAIGVSAVVAQIALIAKIAKAQDGKGQPSDVAFRHPTASNPINSKLGPGAFLSGDLGKLGKIAQQAAPATKNWDQAVAALDSHFAALKKTNPAAAMSAIQSLSQKTGLSMSQLALILPKSATGFAKFAANVASSGLASQRNLYTLDGLSRATAKVGISSGQTAKMLHSLPKFVQTKIETPGALTSRKQVLALAKQFGLTPRQIRTIMTLVGARDATNYAKTIRDALHSLPKNVQTKIKAEGGVTSLKQIMNLARAYHLTPKQVATLIKILDATKAKKQIDDVQKGARKLNQTTAKPHVEPQGTESTNKKLAGNQAGMRKLNTTSAKPKVTLQDNASGAIANVKRELNGVPRNIPVSINIRAYGAAAAIAAAHAAAVQAQIKPHATGGWIHGPGTGTSDSIPALLSNGEFVVNAAAARQNAALLEAINGRGTVSGNRLAAGGPVTSRTVDASGVTVNYNAPVYAQNPDELARKQAARDRAALAMMASG